MGEYGPVKQKDHDSYGHFRYAVRHADGQDFPVNTKGPGKSLKLQHSLPFQEMVQEEQH